MLGDPTLVIITGPVDLAGGGGVMKGRTDPTFLIAGFLMTF